MAGRKSNDQILIEKHPGATPKKLLELGLSQAGYEKLTASSNEPPTLTPAQPTITEAEKPEPVAPTVTKDIKRAVPQLQPLLARQNSPSDQATLIGPEGHETKMSLYAANRMVRKNPAKYKIKK